MKFNAPVLWLPETAFDPLQPPEAVQEVAFVEFQVRVLLAPLATVVGDADSVTVGVGAGFVTATETLARVVPREFEQEIVNVEAAYSAPDLWVPETAFVPLHAPEALHDDARLLDQVNLVVPPELTDVGLAEIVTLGARQ